MRKIIFITCCIALTIVCNAQEFKKFRVGAGLGYALASGEGSSGGVLLTLEPSYRVKDNLSFGLRLESALVTRGSSVPLSSGSSLDVAAISSYTLNGQYYLGKGSAFRPFVGAGLGIYSLSQIDMSATTSNGNFSYSVPSESQFGFYPRLGFDYGHFNMAIDYNFVPSTNTASIEFKNNYIGIRVGVFFGGGKK